MKIVDRTENIIANRFKLDDKKMAFIIPVCAAIIVFDLAFLLKLQYGSIKNTAKKITQVRNNVVTLDRKLAIMKQDNIQQENERADAMTKKMVSEDQMPAILQEIYNLANRHNVKIAQIKPSKDAKAKEESVAGVKLSPLTIALSLECGYHQLGSFLSDLDNLPEFMAVQELKISASAETYDLQNVSLALKTYVKK